MREILFRGKRKDNGEWEEGYYTKGFRYQEQKQLDDVIYMFSRKAGKWTFNDAFVIPETIGQFTGLYDKNGTKIFEGDIVKRVFTLWHGETKKTIETQIGVVIYSNRECGFQIEKKCNLRKPWDGDTIEVIGNIHDTPSC